MKLEYEYGATASVNNGNVTKQAITVPGVADAFVQGYTYDELNRSTSATETQYAVQTWKQQFTFDRYGTRYFDEANTTTLPKNCGPASSFKVCAADKKIVNSSRRSFCSFRFLLISGFGAFLTTKTTEK